MIDTARRGWQVVGLCGALLACEVTGPPSSGAASPATPSPDDRSAAGAAALGPAIGPSGGGASSSNSASGIGGNTPAPAIPGSNGVGGNDTGTGGTTGGGAGSGSDGSSGRDGESRSSDEQRYAILLEAAASSDDD